MDEMILKILTQGSPLVVLVVVVYLFLRYGMGYLKDVRTMDREMFHDMHNQHMDARKATEKALLENADATRSNTKAIESLEQSVMKVINKRL